MDGLMSKLRKLDAYPKVNEDFYSRTLSGGIEKALQRHGGRLEHNETCCGSCYGAETSAEDCCNSCEEVLEAYGKKGWAMTNPEFNGPICKNRLYECLISNYNIHAFICFNPGPALCFAYNILCKREGFLQRIEDEEGEGCNIYGFLEVNKVAGNLQFSPGKSFQQSGVHVHDLLAFQKDSFNISHKITRLAFGEYFPGVVNPHFFNIRGADIGRHQSLPGVFFFYDLSPIKVTFTEEHVSFLHCLTNVCAIAGGNIPS
ncbi:ENDOPLASMIC RETICULUM VESICLE TRANSPORTER PROTEIN [Salix viminalis]|uniref:ENDOPLASMIC RETICULUM VESICLE TRANSPORTER PROTEIN n=1 Tax=Salix viminalis TaxID=40686 RepID=A0A9Q0UHU8_SALVM|nr:ENDOPLASMIC RETICULUM VESICLE TRANSPORTER PROTEIN [Salix viminalis]